MLVNKLAYHNEYMMHFIIGELVVKVCEKQIKIPCLKQFSCEGT